MPEVAAIGTTDYPTPAKRPANSRLDCAKLEQVFGVRLPGWQQSLALVVAEIIDQAA
jgi:dTDP-4-dehydrorhamnose reductase